MNQITKIQYLQSTKYINYKQFIKLHCLWFKPSFNFKVLLCTLNYWFNLEMNTKNCRNDLLTEFLIWIQPLSHHLLHSQKQQMQMLRAPMFVIIIIKCWIEHQCPSKSEWIHKWWPVSTMRCFPTLHRMKLCKNLIHFKLEQIQL